MSEDLIRRSDAIEALGEEPYVWTDDDEFAMGERSQWIDDVSAIEAVSSVDTSEAKEYILSELLDLLEEYSELDENGLHDPKWCGVSEAYGIVKNVPFVDRPQEWIPCSERLPDACKDVLLTCEVRPINHKPFRYVCTAQWIPKFCKEALSIDWDEEATEYCEEDDEYYPREGWYESISNWDDYSLVGIGDFAIAWKPLPEPWKGADDE